LDTNEIVAYKEMLSCTYKYTVVELGKKVDKSKLKFTNITLPTNALIVCNLF